VNRERAGASASALFFIGVKMLLIVRHSQFGCVH